MPTMPPLQRRVVLLALALLFVLPPVTRAQTDRFATAGLTEASARAFFDTLQVAVKANDSAKIADLIEYPLRVNGLGRPRSVTREQFLAKPDAVLTDHIRRQVLAQRFDDLFVNAQGVMFGTGELWFSGVCDKDSPAGHCKGERVRVLSVNLSPTK